MQRSNNLPLEEVKLMHVTILRNLEDSMLSEISQTKKDNQDSFYKSYLEQTNA